MSNLPAGSEVPRTVTVRFLSDVHSFPLAIIAKDDGQDLATWLHAHHEEVERWLGTYGALLFRGFRVATPAQFEDVVVAASSAGFVEYREASTPRSRVAGNIFTATEYPPPYRIYTHNENSHVTSWPMFLFFWCLTPAVKGGATPITDCRQVFRDIPAEVRDEFQRRKWMYIRNFGRGLGFSWQKVFGVEQPSEVDKYCAENHMHAEWKENGLLTVRYRRWASIKHPRTHVESWFNHGTFFHPAALEPALRVLMKGFSEDELPYNTKYGDGGSVAPQTIATLQAAYAANTTEFPWQASDVMMLDNMAMAHGRQPFEGKRQVFVAMTEKVSCSELVPAEDFAWTGT